FVVRDSARRLGGLHSPSRCLRRSDNRSPPLHLLLVSAADDASSPLYRRSRRNSPRDVHQRSASPGRGSSRGARKAQGDLLALPTRRPYSYSNLPPDIKGRRCPQGPQALGSV